MTWGVDTALTVTNIVLAGYRLQHAVSLDTMLHRRLHKETQREISSQMCADKMGAFV